jgi:hypothetical protein
VSAAKGIVPEQQVLFGWEVQRDDARRDIGRLRNRLDRRFVITARAE